MDESEIIRKIIDGHEESFSKVIDLYKKKVASLCYSYTGNYHDAEDLSQEVFISFYKSLRSFRGESSISTFLYRIAISRCVDYKRKRKIKSVFTGLVNFSKEESMDVDDKNYIRQCVFSLPEELKTSVILYYYIGLNQNEIAEILNISQKSVEGRIYRAKKRLKKEFERGGDLLCSKNGMI